MTFFYAAPNRVRLDPGGRGVLNICNGETQHTYFQEPKRYARNPVRREHPLPGMFNPAFPYSFNSPCFLFQRVAEGVTQSELVRSEALAVEGGEVPCHVVSVTYELSPHRGIVVGAHRFSFGSASKAA